MRSWPWHAAGGQAGGNHSSSAAHTHRMVLQRHLAVGFFNVVRVELRRKGQPERGVETVVSTGIHGAHGWREAAGWRGQKSTSLTARPGLPRPWYPFERPRPTANELRHAQAFCPLINIRDTPAKWPDSYLLSASSLYPSLRTVFYSPLANPCLCAGATCNMYAPHAKPLTKTTRGGYPTVDWQS